MDLNFKCPLCDSYFESQDDLSEHVKAAHTSYYYDTFLIPPILIYPSETPLVATETTGTVITTEPVPSPDVIIEPVVPADDGCCECDCCDCAGGGDAAGNSSGDCGDCDCDCDCVIM
ncbi:uncharacterized protein LOC131438668 [Malaya genurostris]|uniref:uncharacterized protein LOC131438668 n=1 Tax=Malaya genurostris TaxID=325434 RepID=UPI0026F3DCC0|nr:uncharacterized protein LOC131438668 [Malaya genurostris]XP_058464818.1 uncharacterized protein LOC131438668 [Malaya genurostris]